MTIQLTFRIRLLSDYHVSAGHGKGALLDSALHRDADGIPVLRGTTITGLLRDGLHELVKTPPLQQSHQWKEHFEPILNLPSGSGRSPQVADFLFGAPWSPKRWRISSAHPLDLTNPQNTKTVQGEIGAQPATHVRVDPALRRAEARKLFRREEGDQRLDFTFTVECQEMTSAMLAEAVLLVAAARMVRYIGAGRRRGRGQCAIHLDQVTGWPVAEGETEADEQSLLTLFETYWIKGQPLKTSSSLSSPSVNLLSQPSTNTPLRIVLLLRTDEPLLIARRSEAGNQFQSKDFISGTVLRGALVSCIAMRYKLDDAAAPIYQVFTRLFFRNGVRLTPLYPGYQAKNNMYPSIPSLQNLFVSEQHPRQGKVKQDDYPIYDAHTAAKNDFRVTDGAASLKLEPFEQYMTLQQNVPLTTVGYSSEMHVTLDENTGRARDQLLFGYTVIEAGQYFIGELLFDNSADWDLLRYLTGLPELPNLSEQQEMLGQASTTFTLSIGKARRRGYGKVTAVLLRCNEQWPGLFEGSALSDRITTVDQLLHLSLISDAIVLDPWGRSYQRFEADWLSETLGVKVRITATTGASGTVYPLQFAHSRVVDTFNNHIGLPRHRDVLLVAGSSVTLEIVEPIELDVLLDRLGNVEHMGIGLRRGEGFGRVVFNHPIYQDTCQNINNMSIRIPQELRPGNAVSETDFSREQVFRKHWEQELDSVSSDDWRKLKVSEFDGLVREIHAAPWTSFEEVHTFLLNYSKPKHIGLPGNWPDRKKREFFEKEGQPGKQGIDVLINLLKKLEKLTADSKQHWEIGCKVLANRLSAIVTQQGEAQE